MEQEQQTNSQFEQIANEKISETERITPVGELLKKSFRIFKQGASKFLGMALLVPLLGMIPLAIVAILYALTTVVITMNNSIVMVSQIILGLLAFISILVLLYVFVISTIGIYILLRDFSPDLKVKEAFQRARPYFWKFIIVNFFVGILVMLWGLLFIIPGIIFLVYYFFAEWVLIFEGYEGMSALRRSKELVKGHWWAVFGRFLAIGLVYLVITIVFIVLLFLAGEGSFLGMILTLIMEIIDIIISIVFVIYSYLIYKDLVKIKGKSQVEKKKDEESRGVIIIVIFLAFLTTIAFVIFVSLNIKARDECRVSDIKTIQSSLDIYYEDNGHYPMKLNDVVDVGYGMFISEDALRDPQSDVEYKYTRKGFGDYELCFEMEEDNRSEYIQGENCVTSEDHEYLMNY